AEGERVTARIDMKERLFLDRIALQARDITEWNLQRAIFVDANLANAAQALADKAPVPARHTAQPIPLRPPQRRIADDRLPVHRHRQRLTSHARRHGFPP